MDSYKSVLVSCFWVFEHLGVATIYKKLKVIYSKKTPLVELKLPTHYALKYCKNQQFFTLI